jgi:glycerophosphoryl diester phosphodiesterase
MKLYLIGVIGWMSLRLLAPAAAPASTKVNLTNYIYSGKSKTIGQVVPAPGGAPFRQVRLVGTGARLFTINPQHHLIASKAFRAKDQSKWYEIIIEALTDQGTVQDTFRIVRDEFIRNKVIAHRGAWKNTHTTENSLAALAHAIRLGCAGSEFDVHLSVDSVAFVHHDPAIQQQEIEKATASALNQLKLPNGESLPTLTAYLQAGIQQNNTKLILEMKPSIISKERSLALARHAVQLVRQHRAQAWIDYISFDYDMLKEVLRLDPYARVAYLNGDKTPAELARDKFFGFDYQYRVLQKQEHWFKEAQQLHLTTNAWTVNDPALMDWLLTRQIDFITTNEPELLLQKIKSISKK